MINPTEKDIGRSVVYKPSHGTIEQGVITSFNEKVVFVRYKQNSSQGQATKRKDLEWLSETNE